MTHDRQHGQHVFVCDSCGQVSEPSGRGVQFDELWSDLKEQGWRAIKRPDGQWEHTCPECGAR